MDNVHLGPAGQADGPVPATYTVLHNDTHGFNTMCVTLLSVQVQDNRRKGLCPNTTIQTVLLPIQGLQKANVSCRDLVSLACMLACAANKADHRHQQLRMTSMLRTRFSMTLMLAAPLVGPHAGSER
jgi:hypothetical protein